MNYSLLRESKVIVFYDGRTYEFDALSNVSAGVDFQEYKTNRKTIHRKSNYAISKITAQNPSSVSLSVYITSTLVETNFFKWMGMERHDNTFILPETSGLEPEYLDLFIVNPNRQVIKASRCFVANVDFSLDKSIPILNVALEAAKVEKVLDVPASGSIIQGTVLPYSPVSVESLSREYLGVTGTSLSFQQQCNWRDQRSVHDIGTIYTQKRAYISEMNASATVNLYNISSGVGIPQGFELEPSYGNNIRIYNKYLSIEMPYTRITKRLDTGDVFTMALDIIPLPSPTPVTITFLGEENYAKLT